MRETGMDAPAQPLIFAKFATSVVGPARRRGDRLRADRARRLEVEPGVVAGDLRLSTRSTARRSRSTTAEIIFGVAELLAYCSRTFTLERGDLLLTGKPWGCGELQTPKRPLAPGNIMETEVEGLGVLRNRAAAAGDRVSEPVE